MINRKDLVAYLHEELCNASDYDESPEHDSGQIFVNIITGDECFVPNDQVITDFAEALIYRKLNVDPPMEMEDYCNAVSPTIDKMLANLKG